MTEQTKKTHVKVFDVVIIMAAIGLTVVAALVAYVKPDDTIHVLIEGANQRWVFPLDADETVRVRGPLGDTVVRIQNNEAWVESSPCDNHTCVGMGHVNFRGAWVACLPNKVFFIIE